ncbi:hypothetical protein FNZ56_09005 [Pseudoluteimonas lycopersici]|uniref:Entry exclusion lipoprotein TrbK n=1 Tax=Pseudoluteimonas lycopersici TaxID=1324796 RepID=A0A516V645_9GAMM|nr:hypothetical protein [Lysobacter lycopersici]QDQ74006.1 hypothetical protein FNZ56_09005 [Lysobacter lycopersici]
MRHNLPRLAALSLVASAIAACGTMQVNDTNAAVDANPLCTSQPNRPGEPVAAECERKTESTWSSDDSKSSEPIDFGKKH